VVLYALYFQKNHFFEIYKFSVFIIYTSMLAYNIFIILEFLKGKFFNQSRLILKLANGNHPSNQMLDKIDVIGSIYLTKIVYTCTKGARQNYLCKFILTF
jgi:hypothetical protein